MLLCLDTSTNYASIALARDQTLVAEHTWAVGQRHSTELLPRLEALLAATDTRPDALLAIAVALGPGSFNGLRVALATAKALAFALRLPLVGVPTLDISAWGQHLVAGALWAIQEAGRGQVYAATYPTPTLRPDTWAPLHDYVVVPPAELPATLVPRDGQPVVVCGEWSTATREAIELALGARARFAGPLSARRAAWLAELALARLAQGQYDEPAGIEPLYLRRPAITTSARFKFQRDDSEHTGDARDVPGGEGAARALRG